jgi:hypothetical protein
MSAPHRDGDLGEHLLAAGRDEEPPEASLERALSVVDQPAPAKPRRVPNALWLLPAAAAIVLVAVVAARYRDQETAAVAEPLPPLPITVPTLSTPAAAPTTSALAAASATGAPSATPSAAPESVSEKGVAVRPRPMAAPKPAAPPPKGTAPPWTGGCAPNDLMCHMRKNEKAPKKK